jgi:N-acyl-L-homoserine lactone synthetase
MDDATTKLIAETTVKLAESALRNTAGIVTDKITKIKAKHDDKQTIRELEDIVNELLEDKSGLIRIAKTYEQELVSQKITEKDIKYITGNVLPLLEKFVPANQKETVDQIKSVISVETLTIMQLLGFNYKRAIGEPLTTLLQKIIESKVPVDGTANQKMQLAIIELVKDPEASRRYEILTGVKLS